MGFGWREVGMKDIGTKGTFQFNMINMIEGTRRAGVDCLIHARLIDLKTPDGQEYRSAI